MMTPLPAFHSSDYAVLGLLTVNGVSTGAEIAAALTMSDDDTLASLDRLRCLGRVTRSPFHVYEKQIEHSYRLGRECNAAKMHHLLRIRASVASGLYAGQGHSTSAASLIFRAVETFAMPYLTAELATDGVSRDEAQWLSLPEMSIATGLSEDAVSLALLECQRNGWVGSRVRETELGPEYVYADWSVAGGPGPRGDDRTSGFSVTEMGTVPA